MTVSLFSVVILLIFITTATIEIYRSFTRGSKRGALSLGNVILSIICAVILSPLFARWIVDGLFSPIVANIPGYSNLISAYPAFDLLIRMAAGAILSSVLFIFVFLILRGIFALTISLQVKSYSQEHDTAESDSESEASVNVEFDVDDDANTLFKDRKSDKIFRVIVGFFSAVLITTAVTAPLMGLLKVTDDAIGMVEDGFPAIWTNAGGVKTELDKIRSYSDDVAGNVFYEIGGKYIFRATAKGRIYDKGVYLLNELDAIKLVFSDFLDAYPLLQNPKNATAENIEGMRKLSNDIKNINACHGVLANYFSDCSKAWLDGKLYLMMRRPSLHSSTDHIVNEILVVCSNSNEDNVKENLVTVLNICIMVFESGLAETDTKDYMALANFIDNKDIIEKLQNELSKNPNTAHINVSEMAMKALITVLGGGEYTSEAYSTFISDMTNAMISVQNRGYGSKEEKASVLTSYTEKYLADLGVSVPESVISSAVDSIVDRMESGELSITEEDVKEMFKK